MAFDAYFIRHAQSAGNAGLATTDPTSIPLTEIGRKQAVDLANLIAFTPATIISSPFLRAQETAKPLHARFPSAARVSLPIHEFTYLAPAMWAGTTGIQRRPVVDAYWERSDHDSCDGEGAESFAAFFRRIEDCLAWLHGQTEGPAILVCHELFIRGVIWRCLSPSLDHSIRTMRAFRAWQVAASLPNASITRITCDAAGSVAITLPFLLCWQEMDRPSSI